MTRFDRRLKVVKHVNSRSGGRVRILHLSDLHFGSGERPRDRKVLSHLSARVRESFDDRKPCDLVVVTGDLANGDKREKVHRADLHEAKNFLLELCERTLLLPEPADRLIVVPGNHDCRRWGLLESFGALKWLLGASDYSEAFYEVFGDMSHHRFFPAMGLLVGCFDSNLAGDALQLAMGQVDLAEFDRFTEQVGQLSSAERDLASQAMRLCLVHHHPLPVGEADDLERRAQIEVLLGRKVVGAPEFLLMRNAGSFLHRALETQFRLVLHGHLHRGSYWRPLTVRNGSEHWLEVIGCGSSARPRTDGTCVFNTFTIDRDGQIDGVEVRFRRDGATAESKQWVTASYDLLRVSDHGLPSGRVPRCKTHVLLGEISYPFGDLVTREIIEGLEWSSEEECSSLPLFTSSSHSIPDGNVTAKCLTPGFSITVERDVCGLPAGEQADEGSRVAYRVRFDPPLIKGHPPLTIVSRRTWLGAMFADRTDKRFHGVTDPEAEWDQYMRRVSWPTERLIIQVRARPAEWPLAKVRAIALDPRGGLSPHELSSGHFASGVWSGDYLGEGALGNSAESAEACAVVYRPRLGFRYGVRWELAERSSVLVSPKVVLLRRLLCGLQSGSRLTAQIRLFLTDVLMSARGIAAANGGIGQEGAPIHAYCFVYDDCDGSLQCKASTLSEVDFVASSKIAWGKDVIGTACRRRTGVGYAVGDAAAGFGVSASFRENVHTMLSVPLMCDVEWVLGVVAISSRGASDLLVLTQARALMDQWSNGVPEMWRRHVSTHTI